MGPPNQPTDPKASKKGSQRDTLEPPRPTPTSGEKTSLELLLESTERTPAFADNQQFNLLRDSLVFNHERILQHSPPFSHHLPQQQGLAAVPPRPATQPHYPSLNTINSQTNNYLEAPTPLLIPPENEEYDTAPKLFSASDRSAQNRANANLDRHVAWQLQQHGPPGLRGRTANDIRRTSPTRGQLLNYETVGDIPLTNTAASLHLPSPPTSEIFRGEVEPPPSTTTVTTVYAYKCNRTSRHVGGEETMPSMDSFEDPVYEERTQEMPYPYGGVTGVLRHQSALDQTTPQVRESEEQIDMDQQQQQEEEDNNGHEVDLKLNSTNMQTVAAPTGDHATDEDLDDELMPLTNRQQQPVFPCFAELRWPDLPYIKATMDPRFHPLLETDFKKDCRTWLWKNERGRRAREFLALGTLPPPPSNSHVTDVSNTIKAFRDNDEVEENDDVAVGIGH